MSPGTLSAAQWAGGKEGMQAIANVVAREALASPSAAAATLATTPACTSDNDFDGRIGLRVSAIFVILFGSLFGILSIPSFGTFHRLTSGKMQAPHSRYTQKIIGE